MIGKHHGGRSREEDDSPGQAQAWKPVYQSVGHAARTTRGIHTQQAACGSSIEIRLTLDPLDVVKHGVQGLDDRAGHASAVVQFAQ